MSAIRTTQLHVSTSDQPGQLAAVLDAAGGNGVNILAYVGYGFGDGTARVLIVTEDNAKVGAALSDAGFEFAEKEVVVVRESDTVGKGAGLARKIADAGVNLTRAYASAPGGEYITAHNRQDLIAAFRKTLGCPMMSALPHGTLR